MHFFPRSVPRNSFYFKFSKPLRCSWLSSPSALTDGNFQFQNPIQHFHKHLNLTRISQTFPTPWELLLLWPFSVGNPISIQLAAQRDRTSPCLPCSEAVPDPPYSPPRSPFCLSPLCSSFLTSLEEFKSLRSSHIVILTHCYSSSQEQNSVYACWNCIFPSGIPNMFVFILLNRLWTS